MDTKKKKPQTNPPKPFPLSTPMQSSPVQFSSLSYVTSETPELSLANNSLSVSGAMGGCVIGTTAAGHKCSFGD